MPLLTELSPPRAKVRVRCSLRALPKGADWCEIQNGRDFLKAEGRWDWAVGNPPFSWCGGLQMRWHL
jgi:hypothetical protein